MVINPFLEVGPEAGVVLRRIGAQTFENAIEEPRNKYGVLILGDVGNGTLRDASEKTSELVYRTLTEKGYPREHLAVFQGKEKNGRTLPCKNIELGKETILGFLEDLSREVTEEDVFFLYILSHGSRSSLIPILGQSYFNVGDGYMSERDLEQALSRMNPNYSVLFFNSCFGGGFAESFGSGRTIAISTSRSDKVTYAQHSPQFENGYGWYGCQFTLHFFSALRGKDLDGVAIGIGQPSIKGAFEYASRAVDLASRLTVFKNVPHLAYGEINPAKTKI